MPLPLAADVPRGHEFGWQAFDLHVEFFPPPASAAALDRHLSRGKQDTASHHIRKIEPGGVE
jgi:hypothetical protein